MRRVTATLISALMLVLLFSGPAAFAEKVEFPEEELATESVLPVFDQPQSVKKRNVSTAKRFEVGGFIGAGLNEAFFDLTLFGFNAGYHLNDIHGLQFTFAAISAKSSQFVPQLNTVGTVPLNLQHLPQPKMYMLLAYEFTPYYGKMSITKQTVINQAMYVTGGVGMMSVGDASSPALTGGIGQNYYFSPRWGMKLDFRGMIFQSPDPLSVDLTGATSTQPNSRFTNTTNFNIAITLGLIVLL